MTKPPAREATRSDDATIDNGATTTQIRLLALVAERQKPGTAGGVGSGRPVPDPSRAAAYRNAAIRGIDFLLTAQYPNGGWPQFYPLRKDYSRHITFNDHAMINVMNLLEDVSIGTPPLNFVDDARRTRTRDAVQQGVEVVLKSQITVGGVLTAWCAQHDEVTLKPRAGRSFEPASLSSSESVGIVRFLMRKEPTAAVVRAIEAAVAWLKSVRLPDGRWARFYEFETNRPIFSGRDGVVRYDIAEIEQERRDGYAWYGTWARHLIEEEFPAWQARRARDIRR